jgi:arsenite methyltransferase
MNIMNNETQLKELVKEKYGQIADQPKTQNAGSCCGATATCCGDGIVNIMADDYTILKGYNPDADLGLGCGLPVAFAKIKTGDTVIDLGSGAGNDCFVARSATGETGKVIGIDFTEKMIKLARINAEKLGFNNVEFRQGDIDDMPVTSNKANVVLSNCVLNLVPNKHKAFSEVFRVLKPGAHFSISDIVLQGTVPGKWKEIAELYAGCISGAIQKQDYLDIIGEAGFINIRLQKEKEIIIPDDILQHYLTTAEIQLYKTSDTKIVSITLYAEKPAKDERACCEPGSSCC